MGFMTDVIGASLEIVVRSLLRLLCDFSQGLLMYKAAPAGAH